MFNRKILIVVSVLLLVVMAVPSLGATFRKKKITEQQFLEMCKEGNTQGVIAAINAGVNVNAKDNDDVTALMCAADFGHTETVNALIKAGSDVNAKSNTIGVTALMLAAANGHTETVNALIDAGADDLTDNDGNTALMYASAIGNAETVNALIVAGSDVKHKDKNGKTALDYARKNPKLKGTDALKQLERLSR